MAHCMVAMYVCRFAFCLGQGGVVQTIFPELAFIGHAKEPRTQDIMSHAAIVPSAPVRVSHMYEILHDLRN